MASARWVAASKCFMAGATASPRPMAQDSASADSTTRGSASAKKRAAKSAASCVRSWAPASRKDPWWRAHATCTARSAMSLVVVSAVVSRGMAAREATAFDQSLPELRASARSDMAWMRSERASRPACVASAPKRSSAFRAAKAVNRSSAPSAATHRSSVAASGVPARSSSARRRARSAAWEASGVAMRLDAGTVSVAAMR